MHNNSGTFSCAGRIKSISHAIQGILEILKSQHNAWIHGASTILVIAFGIFFGVTQSEWCFLVLAISLVWVAEALNTAIEFLCDLVSPGFHPLVKKAKDVAAGAVLFSAMGALVIGLIIFLPYVATA